MKTIAELEAIKKKVLDNVNLRKEREDGVRVVVGMATCGIAAGARPVMTAFLQEAAKRNLNNVVIEQTGCIGMCALEPIVEVYVPGNEKVTYVNMSPEKVAKIVSDHIVNGAVVTEYTVGAQQ